MELDIAIILLVLLALAFDFLNGFHDSANSIATIVSTRVLSPKYAVIWAAAFNFAAYFIFSETHVANTIAKTLQYEYVNNAVIFGALFGACAWNIITWYFGLPTSSSHALVGGMVGAALAKVGPIGIFWSKIWMIAAFIVISPLVGLILGVAFGVAIHWIFRRSTPAKVEHIFRKGQLLSAALYSLGHGGNDAQKTMGIITCLLVSAHYIGPKDPVPAWVAVCCYSAIALGTMLGGWRIVKTMGQKVAKLRPVDGFCAESGATVSLFCATVMGVPVSTTHTITGSIMGVGSLKRMSAVRWGLAGNIIWAWILTIPCSALIAALAYFVVSKIAAY